MGESTMTPREWFETASKAERDEMARLLTRRGYGSRPPAPTQIWIEKELTGGEVSDLIKRVREIVGGGGIRVLVTPSEEL